MPTSLPGSTCLVAALAAAAGAAAVGAQPPPVAFEVRFQTAELAAGEETGKLARAVAAAVAARLDREGTGEVRWHAAAAPPTAARLEATVADGELPCAAPLVLELAAFADGGPLELAARRELYEPCDPDPPFARYDLEVFERDLVAALVALVEASPAAAGEFWRRQ